MIAILDYGAGNLRSLENTLSAIGCPYRVVRDADDLSRASKIVLPGVGHFGQMLVALDTLEVRSALLERVHAGVPFLGICLGLQAMFESSDEAPEARGLGFYRGTVRRFPVDARVPHMGWNQLALSSRSRLLHNLGALPYVYFAHSFYVPADEHAAATCEYGGVSFAAALERGNVFGVQFHPEKSGPVGLRILTNFVEL